MVDLQKIHETVKKFQDSLMTALEPYYGSYMGTHHIEPSLKNNNTLVVTVVIVGNYYKSNFKKPFTDCECKLFFTNDGRINIEAHHCTIYPEFIMDEIEKVKDNIKHFYCNEG